MENEETQSPPEGEAEGDVVEPVSTQEAVPPEGSDAPETPPEAAVVPQAVAETVPVNNLISGDLVKARQKMQEDKQKKLDKIMQRLLVKNEISNDDVQKLVYVSDATATRYLSILEKQGKIRQVGKTGKGVCYALV